MKVLITGGAGFIGQNICAMLAKENIEYDIYSNVEAGVKNLIVGDVIHDNNFQDVVKKYDCIIYLISYGFSQEFFESCANRIEI